MTKQPINPITSQISNPFFGKSLKRRIGSPLYTTYKNGINELEERDRRCREEPTSKESRIFGDVFYLNLIRKIGQSRFDLLRSHSNQVKKWSEFELQQLIKYYSALVDKMLEEK